MDWQKFVARIPFKERDEISSFSKIFQSFSKRRRWKEILIPFFPSMETVSKFRIFQNRFFFFPVSRRDKNVSDLPSQNFQFFNDFFSFFSERQWKERKSVTRIPFFSIKGVSKFRIFLFLVSGRDDRILWLKNVNVIEERIYPLRNFQFFNDFSRRKSFFSMERVSKFRIFSK